MRSALDQNGKLWTECINIQPKVEEYINECKRCKGHLYHQIGLKVDVGVG